MSSLGFSSTPPPLPTTDDDNKNASDNTKYIGLGVGGFIVVCILLGIATISYKHYKENNASKPKRYQQQINRNTADDQYRENSILIWGEKGFNRRLLLLLLPGP
jgi:hypothetical protein